MDLSLKARLIEWFLITTKFNKHSGLRKISNSRKLLEIRYHVPFITKMIYHVKKSKINDIDIYTINKDCNNKVVFYLHGGSYIYNPTILHFRFLNKISRLSNAKIVIPIYKKLPNYSFNSNHDSLIDLYQQLASNNDIILMGDSAGGGLCLSLLPELSKIKVPNKVVLISPWVDFNLKNKDINTFTNTDLILNADSLKILGKLWQGSNENINPINLNIDGLKNVFIFVGDREIFLPDIINKFSQNKNGCLIDVASNMQHNYLLFPIKEASNATDKIVSIIGK